MSDGFPISGNIDPKAFPFLLMDLHKHGATGSLKVEGPSYQKALYFRTGRVLFGSSNDPRDQLGSILIESGKITPEQLEDVNVKVGPGNPLAKALSESGYVNQRELGEAARAKVERILSDVIAYTSGNFEFEDGVLPKGAVDLKLSTERLVLAGVRRVSDRSFVLRHIEGLEVVLAPTPALGERLPEIQSDAGGLPEQIDGRRSLKDAAAFTRLDEFEAAKVACALLFLGLVERRAASSASEVPVFLAEEGGELDLGVAARVAFDESPSPTVAMPASQAEPEPAFFVPAAAPPLADPEPFNMADPRDFAPLAVPVPEPLPEPEPQPEVALAPLPVRAAAASMPAFRPPVVAAPEPPAPEPEPAPVPARASRPSKEDLAALDALLNSRTLEGPLAPFEKPAAPRQERWEPKFGQPARGRRHASTRGPLPFFMAAAALLVLGGGGALWFYWGHAPKPPTRVVGSTPTISPPAAPASATPAPATGSAGQPVPSASPGAAAATPVASPTAPATATRPSPAPPTPASSRASVASGGPGGATLADARILLQKGELAEAARGFAASLRKSPSGGFSIQLLVACSDDTVQKAVQNVPAPELYILTVNFKGRDCYRLCWGIYESEARAGSAVNSVPEYFRRGGAAPKVVPTSGILP